MWLRAPLAICGLTLAAISLKEIWRAICEEDEMRTFEVGCMNCTTAIHIVPDNAIIRRFSEEAWLNHVEIDCTCGVVIRWFAADTETILAELEEQMLDFTIEEHAPQKLRELFYRAHGLDQVPESLTPKQEAQVKFLAWELDNMADELFRE